MRAVKGFTSRSFGSPIRSNCVRTWLKVWELIVESVFHQRDLRGNLQIDYGSNPPVNLKESRDLLPRQYLLEDRKVFHSQLNG